jgi:hypothetical protein
MDFINGGELFSHLQNTRRLPEVLSLSVSLFPHVILPTAYL